jgi:hypothetical protein
LSAKLVLQGRLVFLAMKGHLAGMVKGEALAFLLPDDDRPFFCHKNILLVCWTFAGLLEPNPRPKHAS